MKIAHLIEVLLNKKWIPFLIALICVLLSFWWHMTEDSDSTLNTKNHIIANDEIAAIVNVYKTVPAFAQRPLTTLLIEKTAFVTGLEIGKAFALVNFLLLFISGLLLFQLALDQVRNRKWAVFSMLVYFFSFSNLYLFFPPIYGYDEPLQFSLILLSFITLWRRNWIAFLLFFTLAILARESTSILIPGLAFVLWLERKNGKSRLPIVIQWSYLVLPVLIHAVFVYYFLKWNGIQKAALVDFWDRFEGFKINTETAQAALESLTSLFLVIGIPFYFLRSHLRRNKISEEKMVYLKAFIITLVINSVVVMTVTKAREARLFVIPLFFLWPILGEPLFHEFRLLFKWANYKIVFRKWENGIMFLFALGINYIFSFYAYLSTVSGDSDHYFNEYLFICLLVITLHAFIVNSQQNTMNISE